MEKCTKCTRVPYVCREDLKIYIGIGTDHLIDKIKTWLDSKSLDYTHEDNYFVAVIDNFMAFLNEINAIGKFSSVEKRDILILPLAKDEKVNFGKFVNAKDMNYWITYFANEDIVEAIEYSRIKTLFQPILVNKTLEIYGHECLSRAYDRDGREISAARLFPISKHLDLSFNLDRQCRIQAINRAAELEKGCGKLFINFIPTVIYDPNVCLQTTHAAVKDVDIHPEDIVFEVVESDYVDDYNHLAEILDYYRNYGYNTALDDVGSGYSTLGKFDMLNTGFIKVDMDIIKRIHFDTSAQAYLNQILDLKEETGVMIIAEGIETQEVYDYIKDTEVDLVQGFLFAKPAETFYTKKL